MNANGANFHLLLGEADWGACTVSNGEASTPLSDAWSSPLTAEQRNFVPEWRSDLSAIAIARLLQELPPTLGEARFSLADRRGAAADRHGNIYSVSDDRSAIEVQAAGTRHLAPFWPDPRAKPPPSEGPFEDRLPTEENRVIVDLAALEGHYLLAVLATGELLRFDLVGGGDPERVFITLPAGLAIANLAPCIGGGAFLLDRGARRLYRATPDLRLCITENGQPQPRLFQPEEGPATHELPEAVPWSIDISAITDPISLFQLDEGNVVILDYRAGEAAALYLVTLETATVAELLVTSSDALGLVLLPREPESQDNHRTALLWGGIGNQAHAVTFKPVGVGWEAGEDPVLRPLRRFGGRNLIVANGRANYDSGDPMRWVGIGVKHRCMFAESTCFTTPVYDSDQYQCVWDRIRFDGRIPAGSTVTIEVRAFDDDALFAIDPTDGWRTQPQPYANGDRSELPKLSFARIADADQASPHCWDLLLQQVHGRFAQFRIKLAGDGRQSPAISAMRIWFPRFSYARNFLPEVYSADPVAGDFVDRFLASNEGVNTGLEDRIADARLLIDPRTTPSEALDWLADWFDVALDPSWDERRRRLFIAHAADFFGWRGTLPGLQTALALAFDPGIDSADFALPSAPASGTSGIRILEHFRTRKSARRFPAGLVKTTGVHALIDFDALWQPSEERSGLAERWARAHGIAELSAEQRIAPFSLVAADYQDPPEWNGFMQKQIGFAPSVGAQERARWQSYLSALGQSHEDHPVPDSGAEANQPHWSGFIKVPDSNRELWRQLLAKRYGRIESLNLAWSSDWLSFDQIPLPHHAPDRETPTRDWLDFEGALAPLHNAAHRFSVLIPRQSTAFDPDQEMRLIQLAERIIRLEKPAHTVFDVRMFWAMNRIGEARIGRDTEIGESSRAPQLVPSSILGRSAIGASFAGGAQSAPQGRELLAC